MVMFAGASDPSPIDDAWQLAQESLAAGTEDPSIPYLSSDDVAQIDTKVGTRVGIVFVHGLGSQPAGETLYQWAGPIIRTVWAWSEQRAAVEKREFIDPVVWAQVDLAGQTTPLIELAIPGVVDADGAPTHPPQRWIMTEAWWASEVFATGVDEMAAWSSRHVGEIIDGIIDGIRMSKQLRPADPTLPDRPGDVVSRGASDGLDRIGIGALFTVTATIAVPLYLGLKALSILPIAGLKDLPTAPLDWFLTQWFGDFRIMLHDRAQAANLRNRLATTIEKVKAYGAERVIIVSHSGGTVLSYMLLADPDGQKLDVDKLITHGQAIGLAWKVGGAARATDAFDDGLRDGDRLLRGVHRQGADGKLVPRWVDFHATHDVAPAFSASGWPTPDPAAAPPALRDGPDQGWTIANRMSVMNDHGGYWDNEEQFVIPLLRELDTPGGTYASSRFYPPSEVAAKVPVFRRESRVTALARWWNAWMALLAVSLVGGLAASVLPGLGLSALGRDAAGLIAWLPLVGAVAGLPSWALGALIVIALLYGVFGGAAVGAWNTLDVKERIEARKLQPGLVPRSQARGQMILHLLAAASVAVLAIAPRLSWHIATIDLPGRVPFDLWIGVTPLVLAVACFGLAFVPRVARLVGRLAAFSGWLPESDRVPTPASDGQSVDGATEDRAMEESVH